MTASVGGHPARLLDRATLIRERFDALLEFDPEAAKALLARLETLTPADAAAAGREPDSLLEVELSEDALAALLASPEGFEAVLDVHGPPVVLATGEDPITPPLRPFAARGGGHGPPLLGGRTAPLAN